MQNIVIMIPVYNDWDSIRELLKSIDHNSKAKNYQCSILIVNDCSTIDPDVSIFNYKPNFINKIELLNLKKNLGHQRAIAIGLSYIESNRKSDAVLIMDGDGEDSPSHIQQLIERLQKEGRRKIVFAERSRRSEPFIFKIFYQMYRFFHLLLLGKSIKIGNFCIIPRMLLQRVVASSDLWNHFTATVIKNRIPFTMLPTSRCKRIAGHSKMNFESLVIHGLSAYAVHADVVGVRVLIGSGLMTLLSFMAIIVIIGIRLLTQLAIPGWASILTAILIVFSLQAIQLAGIMTLFILNNRSSSLFMPSRDYTDYIADCKTVFEGAAENA